MDDLEAVDVLDGQGSLSEIFTGGFIIEAIGSGEMIE